MGASSSTPCSACDTNATQPAPLKIGDQEVDQLRQLMEESAEEKKKADEQKAAERRRDEERRAAAERARQEAELRAASQAAIQRREADKKAQEQSRRELERQRVLQLQREEAQAAAAADAKRAQEEADAVAVAEFLKQNGFSSVNELRKFKKGLFRSKRCAPLHVAVDLCDPEMVRLLVAAGADVTAKSGGQTPVDLAQKLGQENLREAQRIVALLDGPA